MAKGSKPEEQFPDAKGEERKRQTNHRKKRKLPPTQKQNSLKQTVSSNKGQAVNTKASDTSPNSLVLPFPTHVPIPPDDFLRNEPPYEESFRTALNTSYLGLVVDGDDEEESLKFKDGKSHPPLYPTLPQMNEEKFFQTDVTQPFGLGTKCAKTYVTRCLVGDPGTTYKYLGLRMFAYSWRKNSPKQENGCVKSKSRRQDLLQAIGDFKHQVLVPRTQSHLQELHSKRRASSVPPYDISRSRPEYNICLINRMDSTAADFKIEPTLQKDRIAVSWHADSSLENYSNIAVYQLILSGDERSTERTCQIENDWSLALRVTPNAEGPYIRADQAPDTGIPTLCLKLPSASTYFMLDDFNHHHQHAVLHNRKEPDIKHQDHTQTIRYSATYRLLRPSHTVQEVLDQCQKACRNFHKRGIKLWRSEQLLLTHVESEWLRQFYIQGKHHYDMLWTDHWGNYILQLWKFWSQLEQRTKQTLDLLQYAAEGKCLCHNDRNDKNHSSTLSKADRKKRDKQKKALATMEDLLSRSGDRDASNPLEEVYEPLAELLEERGAIRNLWKRREKDHVFTTMEETYRPLKLPIEFMKTSESHNSGRSDVHTVVSSPLPENLSNVASQLRAFGKAYLTTSLCDLPVVPIVPASRTENQLSDVVTDSEDKSPTKAGIFGNNSQRAGIFGNNSQRAEGNYKDTGERGAVWERARGVSKRRRSTPRNNRKEPSALRKKKKRRY